jgi:hypothetical protein
MKSVTATTEPTTIHRMSIPGSESAALPGEIPTIPRFEGRGAGEASVVCWGLRGREEMVDTGRDPCVDVTTGRLLLVVVSVASAEITGLCKSKPYGSG